MTDLSRREFVGTTAAAVTALCVSPSLATACEEYATRAILAYPPDRLTVDVASIRNLQLFQKNADHLGLAGVVSTEPVSGRLGSYPAGNLFLFPWVKREGQGRTWAAAVPVSMTQFEPAHPIPDATLPLDEYFCRIVLQAPWTSFIGFQVDKPYSASDAVLKWFSNVEGVAGNKAVGIDWTSANLNQPWFGGSNWIPGTDALNGNAWRRVIVAGLQQASVGV